jgi:hypothetical protein
LIDHIIESLEARGKVITEEIRAEADKVARAYELAAIHGQWESADIIARHAAARIFLRTEAEAREIWLETVIRGFTFARAAIALTG